MISRIVRPFFSLDALENHCATNPQIVIYGTELLLLLEEIVLELQCRHDLRNQGIAYQVDGLTDDSEASSSGDEDL